MGDRSTEHCPLCGHYNCTCGNGDDHGGDRSTAGGSTLVRCKNKYTGEFVFELPYPEVKWIDVPECYCSTVRGLSYRCGKCQYCEKAMPILNEYHKQLEANRDYLKDHASSCDECDGDYTNGDTVLEYDYKRYWGGMEFDRKGTMHKSCRKDWM